MNFYQKQIRLNPYSRGFHLITETVLKNISEIKNIKIGACQIFIKHTSASLTINENADSTVRTDFENYFNPLCIYNKIQIKLFIAFEKRIFN